MYRSGVETQLKQQLGMLLPLQDGLLVRDLGRQIAPQPLDVFSRNPAVVDDVFLDGAVLFADQLEGLDHVLPPGADHGFGSLAIAEQGGRLHQVLDNGFFALS